MSSKTYTYLPQIKKSFRCRVPIEGIRQVFLVDGQLQEIPPLSPEIALTTGPDGKGLTMRIGASSQQEPAPVQIISVRKEDMPQPVAFTNQWILEPNARAQMVVCDHTLETFSYQTQRTTIIRLGKGAKLDILFMQNEHSGSTYHLNVQAYLGEDAQLDCHILSLYGGIIRNTVNVTMDHPGASCDLNGLFLADAQQQMDYQINIDHNAPRCRSQQLFKSILDNKARASFSGLIKVAPDAQKTEAYQANHNLLLSQEARIDTRPQLEIYADDVQCSHGATIGRMDQDGLFYMRSRGISVAEAKMLQQMAFVQDVLSKVKTRPIRERLENMVESRLRGDFLHCSHCTMHCC